MGRAQLSPVPPQLCPWTHFITLHKGYIEPRYVLRHENATLQGVTKTHAFFCVSSPGEDVQDIKGIKINRNKWHIATHSFGIPLNPTKKYFLTSNDRGACNVT